MTIEEIKERIKALRALKTEDEAKARQELARFREELADIGLTIFWSTEEQDYAIYCNE